MTDLTFNIPTGRLSGAVDGYRVDTLAGSGGRAGSKIPGAENWHLSNNPLATHVGGPNSRGTHAFGPIPIGDYVLRVHETRQNWVRLLPGRGNSMHGRTGFAIHGRGEVGSHGCLVLSDFGVLLQLIQVLKARESRGGAPPTLEVVAVGTDLDRKFRAV